MFVLDWRKFPVETSVEAIKLQKVMAGEMYGPPSPQLLWQILFLANLACVFLSGVSYLIHVRKWIHVSLLVLDWTFRYHNIFIATHIAS